jgi:hypothetical protein
VGLGVGCGRGSSGIATENSVEPHHPLLAEQRSE